MSTHRTNSGVKFLDAFEQVEGEGGTGKVNSEILLQMQGDTSTPQATGGEAPVAPTPASGLEDALLYQGLDELGLDGTGTTQFHQSERALFVN